MVNAGRMADQVVWLFNFWSEAFGDLLYDTSVEKMASTNEGFSIWVYLCPVINLQENNLVTV